MTARADITRHAGDFTLVDGVVPYDLLAERTTATVGWFRNLTIDAN